MVLVEAISIIVRQDAIKARYPGGLEAFEREIPNDTFCTDGEVCRVGFMSPAEIAAYDLYLQGHGLKFLEKGEAVDFVIVDQLRGPTTPCPWLLHFDVVFKNGGVVAVAGLKDGQPVENTLFYAPQEWDYENSLSSKFKFTPLDQKTPPAKLENGLVLQIDPVTGKRYYCPNSGQLGISTKLPPGRA